MITIPWPLLPVLFLLGMLAGMVLRVILYWVAELMMIRRIARRNRETDS